MLDLGAAEPVGQPRLLQQLLAVEALVGAQVLAGCRGQRENLAAQLARLDGALGFELAGVFDELDQTGAELGLAGRDLDWDEIENWIRVLTETEGLKYNLCQALAALLFARAPHRILDASAYRLLPDRAEALVPTAVMHHYVAESKQWYRRHAWRLVA